ncbi:MAG: hypothetical protein SGARI_006353 [Bacillariaceae sp.]
MKSSPTSLAMVLAIAYSAVYQNTCTEAFAPVHHNASPRLASPRVMMDQASATALHANLFDRFFRVVNANLNNALKTFEDPEKVMSQALEDMQNDLVRVRQTYSELALKKNNEGLAREALARREALTNQANTIQSQIDSQANNLDTLYEGMQALEKKIVEAAGKKNEMAARAKTAKSTQKINDMLSGLTGKTSMDAFNRMEEKVLALEASAEVSNEMAKTMMGRSLPSSKKDGASSVELQFRALESSDAVDKEMEKLKAKMLPASSKKIPVEERDKAAKKEFDYLGL